MVEITKLKYKEWDNSYRITNKKVEIIVLSDVGPRIIRYGFLGGMNQFAEFPEHSGLVGGMHGGYMEDTVYGIALKI